MLTALRHDPGITLLDRAQAKTPEETKKIYHDALSSDFYFMSTNAITKDGELVNIDGTGNRVAALIYGPEHVIVMAGMNKVAANVDEALSRVHGTATPMNCKRLGKNTPCLLYTSSCQNRLYAESGLQKCRHKTGTHTGSHRRQKPEYRMSRQCD